MEIDRQPTNSAAHLEDKAIVLVAALVLGIVPAAVLVPGIVPVAALGPEIAPVAALGPGIVRAAVAAPEIVPVVEPVPAIGQVEAIDPARDRRVGARTALATEVFRPAQVPVLAVVASVAAAPAPPEPAAAGVATAWAAADSAAAADVAAVDAVAVVVDAVAAVDDGDKRRVDEEETDEIKTKYHDFDKIFPDRFSDLFLRPSRQRFASGARVKKGCHCGIAAKTEGI